MKWLSLPLLIIFLIGSSLAEYQDPWTEEPQAEVSPAQGLPESTTFLPFNLTGQEPDFFSIGGDDVPFAEYVSKNRSHEIWIRNENTWQQSLLSHQGDEVELVSYTPSGGTADLYLISYSNSTISHISYELYRDYYSMKMRLEELGRIMMVFSVNSQPANALIIDVLPQEASPANLPVEISSLPPGKAKVTVKSEKVKGYDVYVDGAFYSSDIMDGSLDGVASFEVRGDRMHDMVISKRGELGQDAYKSEHKRSFASGYSYTLNT